MRKFYKRIKRLLIFLLISNFTAILAQTTCNNGLGRVLYERLPNQQLQGFDDDVVRDTAPPFRVLEKCQDLCLRDRTASNNLVRACTSFDFQPGSRIASFSGNAEYEESICYLTREQAAPEGIGNLMLVPNSVHFTEVCLTSTRPERECPSRRYVFERHPRKKLKLPISDIKEMTAANRTDCEDKCLNEFSFVCRSANFDTAMRSCTLSRFTRRTHPELLEDDANTDYLENTCLNAERRCDGLAVFVKEENKRLGGPFEVDIFNNMTLEECQTMCLRAEKYFCRSVEYDDQTKQCILSEEDSISQKDDISISSSPTHHFYDLVCLDNQRGTDYPDNSVTSHLFSSGRRPDTAFQRYRNSRLGGEFHSEITGRSLSECLDECLRQTSFQCKSAVYSDRFRTCRLSRYSQKDGMRIIYDADYDYYENLMLNVVGSEGDDRPSRPEAGGSPDWRPPPAGGDDRYPNRYPSSDEKYPTMPDYDRYPPERYPEDKYRPGDRDRYPPERYPEDKYRPGDRDRYPPERYPEDKYRPGDRDRYPPERYPEDKYSPGDRDRYPPERYPEDKYRPGDRDRYPPERHPEDEYRPGDRDRYPPERYPDRGGGRYPPIDGDQYPGRDRFPDRGRFPAPRLPPHSIGGRPPLDDLDDRRRFPYYDFPSSSRHPDEVYPGRDRFADRGRFPPPRLPPHSMGGRPPLDDLDDRRRFPYYDFPSSSRHPDEVYPGRDRFPDRGRFPPPRLPPHSIGGRPPLDDIDDRRRFPYYDFPSSSKYPDDVYPPRSTFIPRYPIEPPYTDKDSLFPDRRHRPSSTPHRYPIEGPPISPASPHSRYPPDPSEPDDIPDRRPDLDTGKRYPPPPPPPPVDSKYPSSPNRFPVGTDRYPIDIYKYGSRGRRPHRPGYDRRPPPPSPSYYDLDYEERYLSRPPSYPGYGPDYDREYDGGHSRRPGGYPSYDIGPAYRPPSGYDNSINPISGDGFGGYGPARPHVIRCEEADNFKLMSARQKMRRQFIRRSLNAPTLVQCQRECVETQDFTCRSFNYRDPALSFDDRDVSNCELSDRDTRELDIHNSNMFDSGSYDFYERSFARNGADGECLDVSQVCNEDGMEFTLRTPEGFVGRIYTYGFYDRCFYRGNGGTVNVLRISGPAGYPECGSQRYGDTLTNIVVVQFSDNVQTSRDKRYNLTCIFRGPGEAVVTSGYIGAGFDDPDRSGSPIPIEYLPAENTLSSKVRLMILYQGRPTTTIAVGDPLTFRLEAQDGYNHATDIFATNVVARDPYSGRSIQLIDRFGCPVDPFVFPELDKLRDGDTLEARFNAFKIPESNFLVFEATVRTCREGCQPAYCPGPAGRSEPSFGRRKRSLNETDIIIENEIQTTTINSTTMDEEIQNKTSGNFTVKNDETLPEEPEQVREMIEVFESREEIDHESFARKLVAPVETVCLTPSEYHGLISAVILLMILLFSITLASGLAYRRYWQIMSKNRSANRNSPISSFIPSTIRTHERFSDSGQSANNCQRRSGLKSNGISLFGGSLNKTFATGNLSRMCQIPVINPIRSNNNNASQFDDPSEPIYTDPSLFERSRSLRSLSVEGGNEV